MTSEEAGQVLGIEAESVRAASIALGAPFASDTEDG
jgi:hypothetical protein